MMWLNMFSFLFFFNGFSGICLAAPLICFNVLKFSTFDCKNITGLMRKLSSCMVFDIDFTFGTMYYSFIGLICIFGFRRMWFF